MKLSRRSILKSASILPLIPAVGIPGTTTGCSSGPQSESRFRHGVASGDPTQEAVILWTRISEVGGEPVAKWKVATDAAMSAVVKEGQTTTNAARDFTVKVDANGLVAGTTYYYQFEVEGILSPIGRTKTLPPAGVARARLGVVSCANYANGYFHVYARLAERKDLDAVVHVGDYIYEYASDVYGNLRPHEPPTLLESLDDFRKRYAQYRADEDTKEAHRQHPFIHLWDDHEFADNAYSNGESGDSSITLPWAQFRSNAEQAFHEWLPIRTGSDPAKIYRHFSIGDLAELIMLDTRMIGRSQQLSQVTSPGIEDPARQLLGTEQETYLKTRLTESPAQWKIVGQQVLMTDLRKVFGNTDQWDGYPAARARILQYIKDNAVKNVVVLAGDLHSSWASEISLNPLDPNVYNPATGSGTLAVEFVTPAISSPSISPAIANVFIRLLPQDAPQVKFAELQNQGYMVVDIDAARVQAAWFRVADIRSLSGGAETFVAAFKIDRNGQLLAPEASAASERENAPALVP